MAIKTVTCQKCGAEQAILRDEDGNMNCLFCGAPMDLPAYEPGEEPDASYEQPEEPEKLTPEGEPIPAVFVLSEEEVGTAFAATGKVKERKYILWIETVILAGFGTAILVMNILGLLNKAGMKPPEVATWLYVVLCYGMLPVIWIMPRRTKRKMIRNATSGNQLTVTIYENLMEIHIEGRDPKDDWQQPFDGSYGYRHEQGLFLLSLKSGQILVIPERSLTPEQVETVARRLEPKPEPPKADE